MQLIPADEYTIEDLTDIYNETRIDYMVPMPMSVDRLLKYIRVYDVDLSASVVAADEEGPIGLCMLGVRDQRAWITRLGVIPNTRRGGAGEAMMCHVIDQAEAMGIPTVYLEVIKGNKPAKRLFEKLGFVVIRELLILRRAPGAPEEYANPTDRVQVEHYSNGSIPNFLVGRSWQAAWTNQAESVVNAGEVQLLHLVNLDQETSGWITYMTGSAFQLQRVIVGPDDETEVAPAWDLLYELHSRFPALDTVAENVPADAPHLQAFFDHGYFESFARIEMVLDL